ncbi:hypothetical protein VTJ04DRAFT_8568 [Mycothermus thermophilus]|uniref:uncharacterized protein n=1 Tax=Humicola insolens TaxID=85995 RepID=UPI0037442B9A
MPEKRPAESVPAEEGGRGSKQTKITSFLQLTPAAKPEQKKLEPEPAVQSDLKDDQPKKPAVDHVSADDGNQDTSQNTNSTHLDDDKTHAELDQQITNQPQPVATDQQQDGDEVKNETQHQQDDDTPNPNPTVNTTTSTTTVLPLTAAPNPNPSTTARSSSSSSGPTSSPPTSDNDTTTSTTTSDDATTPPKTNPKKMSYRIRILDRAGDFFSAPRGAVLIHACNALGVWGGGIAAAFADRYPEAYRAYRAHCRASKPVLLAGTGQLIPPLDGAVGRQQQQRLVLGSGSGSNSRGKQGGLEGWLLGAGGKGKGKEEVASGKGVEKDEEQLEGEESDGGETGPGHYVGCLYTSRRFGRGVDSPSEILRLTVPAMRDLLRQIAEEGVKVTEVRMCRINSGIFNVPWRETKAALEAAEFGEDGKVPACVKDGVLEIVAWERPEYF